MEPIFQVERRVGPDSSHLVRVTIAEVDGRLRVVGVELWGIEPPADPRWIVWGNHLRTATPITPAELRLPITRLADEAVEELRDRWAGLIARSISPEAARGPLDALGAPGRRRGRVGYGPEHWEAVKAVAEANLTGTARAVAEHFVVSRRTAQEWVRRVSRERVSRNLER